MPNDIGLDTYQEAVEKHGKAVIDTILAVVLVQKRNNISNDEARALMIREGKVTPRTKLVYTSISKMNNMWHHRRRINIKHDWIAADFYTKSKHLLQIKFSIEEFTKE